MSEALIVVDLQYDFLPGGALGVKDGDRVIPTINQYLRKIPLSFATADYHPENHGSFASAHAGKTPGDVIELHGIPQVLWPDHCVIGSRGAQLTDAIDRQYLRAMVTKGSNPRVDSYSGFFDNDRQSATGLHSLLGVFGVRKVYVMGIATDYCVRATVLDALRLDYEVVVVRDGCAGVNLQPKDSEHALMEMATAGALIL